MSSAADVRALVLTPDAVLASTFLDISRELGVMTDISDLQNGAPAELGREKYEALLIDFDAMVDAPAALTALRANPSNRGSVIFAVATANERQQLALTNGANFVLSRPVDAKELRRTLYAAYDAMTGAAQIFPMHCGAAGFYHNIGWRRPGCAYCERLCQNAATDRQRTLAAIGATLTKRLRCKRLQRSE
jgi:CheY-like chemotaxis protein